MLVKTYIYYERDHSIGIAHVDCERADLKLSTWLVTKHRGPRRAGSGGLLTLVMIYFGFKWRFSLNFKLACQISHTCYVLSRSALQASISMMRTRVVIENGFSSIDPRQAVYFNRLGRCAWVRGHGKCMRELMCKVSGSKVTRLKVRDGLIRPEPHVDRVNSLHDSVSH
jgi:hypothetical protein